MSEHVERVAEALRQHTWWLSGNLGIPGMQDSTTYKCNCGWSGDEPHAHVAQAAIEALGLTEQWAALYDDGILAGDIAEELAAERCQSCDSCRGAQPKHVESRLVSPWVQAGAR